MYRYRLEIIFREEDKTEKVLVDYFKIQEGVLVYLIDNVTRHIPLECIKEFTATKL